MASRPGPREGGTARSGDRPYGARAAAALNPVQRRHCTALVPLISALIQCLCCLNPTARLGTTKAEFLVQTAPAMGRIEYYREAFQRQENVEFLVSIAETYQIDGINFDFVSNKRKDRKRAESSRYRNV